MDLHLSLSETANCSEDPIPAKHCPEGTKLLRGGTASSGDHNPKAARIGEGPKVPSLAAIIGRLSDQPAIAGNEPSPISSSRAQTSLTVIFLASFTAPSYNPKPAWTMVRVSLPPYRPTFRFPLLQLSATPTLKIRKAPSATSGWSFFFAAQATAVFRLQLFEKLTAAASGTGQQAPRP
jgi:hypothetical protein